MSEDSSVQAKKTLTFPIPARVAAISESAHPPLPCVFYFDWECFVLVFFSTWLFFKFSFLYVLVFLHIVVPLILVLFSFVG